MLMLMLQDALYATVCLQAAGCRRDGESPAVVELVWRVDAHVHARVAGARVPALPDAANLLSGLPDEVDWDAQSEEDDEPAYDRKGTRYNAVALPSILSQQGEQQSVKMVSLQRRPGRVHGEVRWFTPKPRDPNRGASRGVRPACSP